MALHSYIHDYHRCPERQPLPVPLPSSLPLVDPIDFTPWYGPSAMANLPDANSQL